MHTVPDAGGGSALASRPVTCQAPGQVFHGCAPVTLTRAVNSFCRKGSNCPTILSQEGDLGPGLPDWGPPSLDPRDLEAAQPGSQQVGPRRPRPGFGVTMPHSLGSPPPWDSRLGFLSSGEASGDSKEARAAGPKATDCPQGSGLLNCWQQFLLSPQGLI